ncbi:MAG: hypothetical protein DI535_05935 [Citrobacter freundii]|nr:MAG: hypothetical protein DI535_05935 [Citrobacter freundii]
MSQRAAIDTIRGYYYQFDATIASLLTASQDNDKVTVEGVEDIDINTTSETTAIQCKYYEKTEFNFSVIAEPIRWMLTHYKSLMDRSRPRIRYKLRGHYNRGQQKLQLPLSVQSLKDDFLTYTSIEGKASDKKKVTYAHHNTLGLTDEVLEDFLEVLEIDIHAPAFQKQFEEIIKQLRKYFNCNEISAELLYYNNALGIIRKLATEPDEANRSISKKDFLAKLTVGNVIFNEWYILRKGENEYLRSIRALYFSSINILFTHRIFLLEPNRATYVRSEVKDIIVKIQHKYTKVNNQPHPFCPFIFLQGIDPGELKEIKKDLSEEGFHITDGFEYEHADFNAASLLLEERVPHKKSLRFINTIAQLTELLVKTGRRTQIYQFYVQSPYFNHGNPSAKEINIQVTDLKNLNSII